MEAFTIRTVPLDVGSEQFSSRVAASLVDAVVISPCRHRRCARLPGGQLDHYGVGRRCGDESAGG